MNTCGRCCGTGWQSHPDDPAGRCTLCAGTGGVPEPAAHSEHGASSCSRWWNCPGSVRLARTAPPGRSSVYAEEGTAAHELAALCLTNGQDAIEYTGRTIHAHEVTDEMAEAVQVYIDVCRSRPGDVRMVEHRFDLSALQPPAPMFGTADHCAYDSATQTLYVDDLKYGAGVRVVARGNPQLKYYALGATLALDRPVSHVVAAITQPRGFGASPEPVEYNTFDLVGWAENLLDHARATMAPDAPLSPGSWCRFCPAAGICPEQTKQALAVAQAEFADAGPYSPPAPETLTPDDVARMLPQVPAFEAWVKAFTAHAHSLAGAGLLPDWKLVATEGRETWRDKETVAKELAAAAKIPPAYLHAPPAALSPAKARGVIAESFRILGGLGGVKLTKKQAEVEARAVLAPFTHRPNTGTALVSVTDSRPALAGGGSEFTALPVESN